MRVKIHSDLNITEQMAYLCSKVNQTFHVPTKKSNFTSQDKTYILIKSFVNS